MGSPSTSAPNCQGNGLVTAAPRPFAVLNYQSRLVEIVAQLTYLKSQYPQGPDRACRTLLAEFLAVVAYKLTDEQQDRKALNWEGFLSAVRGLFPHDTVWSPVLWEEDVEHSLRSISESCPMVDHEVDGSPYLQSVQLFTGLCAREGRSGMDWMRERCPLLFGANCPAGLVAEWLSVLLTDLVEKAPDPLQQVLELVSDWVGRQGVPKVFLEECCLIYLQQVTRYFDTFPKERRPELFNPFLDSRVPLHLCAKPVLLMTMRFIGDKEEVAGAELQSLLGGIRAKLGIQQANDWTDELANLGVHWWLCSAERMVAPRRLCQLAWLLVEERGEAALEKWAAVCLELSLLVGDRLHRCSDCFAFVQLVWMDILPHHTHGRRISFSVSKFETWARVMGKAQVVARARQALEQLFSIYEVSHAKGSKKERETLITFYLEMVCIGGIDPSYLMTLYREKFALDTAWIPDLIRRTKSLLRTGSLQAIESCLRLIRHLSKETDHVGAILRSTASTKRSLAVLRGAGLLIDGILQPAALEGDVYDALKEISKWQDAESHAEFRFGLFPQKDYARIPDKQWDLLLPILRKANLAVSLALFQDLPKVKLDPVVKETLLSLGVDLAHLEAPCMQYLEAPDASLKLHIDAFVDDLVMAIDAVISEGSKDQKLRLKCRLDLCAALLETLLVWECDGCGIAATTGVASAWIMNSAAKTLSALIFRVTEEQPEAHAALYQRLSGLIGAKWREVGVVSPSIKTPMYTSENHEGIALTPIRGRGQPVVIMLRQVTRIQSQVAS